MSVTLLLFAGAREAAGCSRATFPASGLEELLERACAEYGPDFVAVLATARIWINEESPPEGVADPVLVDGDEVAVLPPVSGG